MHSTLAKRKRPCPWILLPAILLFSCKTTNDIGPQGFVHQDNVFAYSTNWYVNPLWSENARQHGGEAIAHNNTAIWLQSMGDIEPVPVVYPREFWPYLYREAPLEGMGLREHLLEAQAQGNALVQLVIYNLPGRDCADVESKGELPASEVGFEVYKSFYIDRIAEIIEDFPHIPLAVIIEPNSLIDLILNKDTAVCQEVSNQKPYGYANAVRYAINRLSNAQNVHLYLDIEAANKNGWVTDLELTTLFMHGVIGGFDGLSTKAQAIVDALDPEDFAHQKYDNIADVFVEPPTPASGAVSPPGYFRIDGFISNVSDYVPVIEPYLGNPDSTVGGAPLKSAYFYEGNPHFGELNYTLAWLSTLDPLIADDIIHLGILIDTGRNGWGQNFSRLNGNPGQNQDPNQVDDFRIDGREHRLNWCNQPGGIGARPQANPDGIHWLDAYVWTKPPGESDGVAGIDFEVDPNGFNRKYDPSCDPDKLSTFGEMSELTDEMDLGTGAMPNAPRENQWFADGFRVLRENAWPPICFGHNDQCD